MISQAIRAVVAAQWAIACTLFDRWDEHHTMLSPEWVRQIETSADALGELPSATEIVEAQ